MSRQADGDGVLRADIHARDVDHMQEVLPVSFVAGFDSLFDIP